MRHALTKDAAQKIHHSGVPIARLGGLRVPAHDADEALQNAAADSFRVVQVRRVNLKATAQRSVIHGARAFQAGWGEEPITPLTRKRLRTEGEKFCS